MTTFDAIVKTSIPLDETRQARAKRLLGGLSLKQDSSRLSIYLAGKIGKSDWRHDVVLNLRDAQGGHWGDYSNWLETPWGETATVNRYVNYVGPYFMSCDHGCSHDCNAHGIGTDEVPGCWTDATCSRRRVTELCLTAIERADVFFAWLPPEGHLGDHTAYGSLAELGYAKAAGTPVITCAPSFDTDLWFAHHMADHNIVADDPITGLQAALIAFGMEARTK
jgi:hypothetical protein